MFVKTITYYYTYNLNMFICLGHGISARVFTVFGTAEILGEKLKCHNFSIYMYIISYTDLNVSFAVSAYNLLKVCSKGSHVISPYQTTLARNNTLDLSCYSSVLCECGNKELRFLLQHFFTIVLLTFYSLERVLWGYRVIRPGVNRQRLRIEATVTTIHRVACILIQP